MQELVIALLAEVGMVETYVKAAAGLGGASSRRPPTAASRPESSRRVILVQAGAGGFGMNMRCESVRLCVCSGGGDRMLMSRGGARVVCCPFLGAARGRLACAPPIQAVSCGPPPTQPGALKGCCDSGRWPITKKAPELVTQQLKKGRTRTPPQKGVNTPAQPKKERKTNTHSDYRDPRRMEEKKTEQ